MRLSLCRSVEEHDPGQVLKFLKSEPMAQQDEFYLKTSGLLLPFLN